MGRMADSVVLCYHAVSETWPASLAVTPDDFERQMRWLVDHGWRGSTFRDLVGGSAGERAVAITFDDAFASVATVAFPILSSLGLPATVFAPTDYIDGGKQLQWPGIDQWANTSHAHELKAMSWDTLGMLTQSGWEVGSHTQTHPHLTELDTATLRAELEGSREVCRDRLEHPCDSIAYPYGDADERVAERAREAGYVAGATLPHRLQRLGPHRVPRIGIYRDDQWWRFRLKLNPAIRRARRSSMWPDRMAKPRRT